MKRDIITVGIIALCGFVAGLGLGKYIYEDKSTYHTCIDRTHRTCDGRCECDGMDCGLKSDYIYTIK